MIISKTCRFFREFSTFVPKHDPLDPNDQKAFLQFLNRYDNILVLTGAGVSTESGIPDYRSEHIGMFAKNNYKPVQYSEFINNHKSRQRYWARNFVAWPKFSSVSPNKVHHDLYKFQTLRKVTSIITQNVDGLHSKAGSENVLELHGNAYWVKCLQCETYIERHEFQNILQQLNSECSFTPDALRPDGDVEIEEKYIKDFIVPECEQCGGILKPTIVFFGENIPEKRVKRVEKLVEECDALLVLGTSLSTLSSYRICFQAFDLCKFLCIVNIGPTRGDKLADLKITAKCSEVLPVVKHKTLIH